MMNKNIRIAKELVRLVKILSGATIHHYVDFNDDIEAINDACEKNGCTVKYKFTKYSMDAIVSNGCTIIADEWHDPLFNEDDEIEYSVEKDGHKEGFGSLDDAIDFVFGHKNA